MASGTPIVTTLSGSIPEVVDDAAALVPPSDFLALRDAMADIIRSPDKRKKLSRKGRDRAELRYDSFRNASELRKAYENLF